MPTSHGHGHGHGCGCGRERIAARAGLNLEEEVLSIGEQHMEEPILEELGEA